jgi:hypothetical protein
MEVMENGVQPQRQDGSVQPTADQGRVGSFREMQLVYLRDAQQEEQEGEVRDVSCSNVDLQTRLRLPDPLQVGRQLWQKISIFFRMGSARRIVEMRFDFGQEAAAILIL